MPSPMSNRQRILATFHHQKIDRVVFSPRIHYWFARNGREGVAWFFPLKPKKTFGPVPQYLKGRYLWDLFDYLDASPRYVTESYLVPLWWINVKHGGKVGRYYGFGKDLVTEYRTPVGKLRKVVHGGYIQKHHVETVEDMKVMRYILDYLSFTFPRGLFHFANALLGPRGVVQTFFPRSPLMRLIVDYMGWQQTIVNLRRHPAEMHELLLAIERWDDVMFKKLCESPIPVYNFGDNIDARLTPPRYFEKYLVPYYKKRVAQLHHAGKFCHLHMDGELKPLLPFIKELPFDGIEAMTAKPQGDVTLEEIKGSIGNKVLLDGLPAFIFLPQYTAQYVREYTQKVLEMFSPNLILGISDELPPNADIRKVQMVASMVKCYNP